MRLKSIQLRGFTAIRDTVSLEIPATGLVAIVGENGAGKSTLMEAAALATYKVLPSRGGSLYQWAHGRDAFAHAAFEDDDGHTIACLVKVDAERQKTESYISVDGESLTTGRAAEFEDQVARRFGSYELFLASVFSAQDKAGNFLLMPKALRKGLFAELLGLQHLGVLTEAAKLHRARAEGLMEEIGRRVVDIERQQADVANAPAEVAGAEAAEQAAAERVEAARREEGDALTALERGRAAGERLSELRRQELEAQAGVDTAREELGRAELLEPTVRKDIARRRREHAEETQWLEDRRGELVRTLEAEPALRETAGNMKALKAEKDDLNLRAREAESAKQALGIARGALEAAQQRLRDAQAVARKEAARIKEQVALLERVPCTKAGSWKSNDDQELTKNLSGDCPLLEAARVANRQPVPEPDVELSRATAKAQIDLDTRAAEFEELALTLDPIRVQEVELLLAGALTAATKLEEITKLREHLEDVDGRLRSRAASAATIDEDELLQVSAAGDLVAKRRRLLEEAVVRLARAAGATAAAVHGPSVEGLEGNLSKAREARISAEGRRRTADLELAKARGRLKEIEALAVGLAEALGKQSMAREDVGDHRLLEEAFGKNGIQALEIDAAGPEVARLANDLLEACYGPRFSISFETLREKKSEKGAFSEVFEVQVYDARRSGYTPVEGLSGGEKIIVGEAVGLALSIFNARRSGVRWRTLFRDETAGALSSGNAQAYVDMLRRALALGDFAQVLFISHSPEVWERADARVFVEDGKLRDEAAAP